MTRQLMLVPLALIACAGLAMAGQPTAKPAKPADTTTKAPAKPEATLKVGDKAPAIAVDKWVKGEPVKGFEKGKVYVVEFWATWCGPCIAMIPHMTEMQKKYKDVTFMSIAASERMPKDGADKRLENVEKFVKDQGDKMGYRVGYDSKRAMGTSYMTAAGQNGIPCSFLVDGEGKIAWIGHPSKLEAELEKIAAPKKVASK
ncbi:MAG: TlpA family protein disulfide reductase [Phycisphaerales bacterium]